MSASTSCDCPAPPGGTVTCDAGQAAYCWVDETGTLRGGCITLPAKSLKSLSDGKPLAMVTQLARALSEIVGHEPEIRRKIMAAISEEQETLEIEIPGARALHVALPTLFRRREPEIPLTR